MGPDRAALELELVLELFIPKPVQKRLLRRGGELAEGGIHGDLHPLREGLDGALDPRSFRVPPHDDRAFAERLPPIRDHEVWVDLKGRAESIAGLAGAVGTVE